VEAFNRKHLDFLGADLQNQKLEDLTLGDALYGLHPNEILNYAAFKWVEMCCSGLVEDVETSGKYYSNL
jgi:hypothetical protein